MNKIEQYEAVKCETYRVVLAEIPNTLAMCGLESHADQPIGLRSIDNKTLAVWRDTWPRKHASGVAAFDWNMELRRFTKPACLKVGIWCGDALCGPCGCETF